LDRRYFNNHLDFDKALQDLKEREKQEKEFKEKYGNRFEI